MDDAPRFSLAKKGDDAWARKMMWRILSDWRFLIEIDISRKFRQDFIIPAGPTDKEEWRAHITIIDCHDPMTSRWTETDRRSLGPEHLLNVVGTVASAKQPSLGSHSSGATEIFVERLYSSALDRHNDGDVGAAGRGYRRVLAIAPRHPGASKYLAKIEFRNSTSEESRGRTFRRLLPMIAVRSGDSTVNDLFARVAPFPAPVGREPVGGLYRSDHFIGLADRERAKQLFSQTVINIDLELFSYCNRRCLYCPNVFIDRISSNNYLPGSVYRMIVRDLAEIGYRGKITLNFYNEPLADPVTVQACRELRALLPGASIRMNTNGDYLNERSLEEIRDAGLNHLMISLHVSAVVDWDDDKVKFRAEQIYERVGRRPETIDFRPGEFYRAFIPFEGMKVEVVQGNYNQSGYNIGGLMRHIPAPTERLSPCDEPFKSMTVTYNGNLTPCCRIRGDAEAHKPYVTASLVDYGSIYEAWANDALAGWRRHLLGFNPKASPCHECKAVRVADTPAERKKREAAARLIPAGERQTA